MELNCAQTQRTAERHLSRGRITAAIEEYRKLVDWDPTDLNRLNTLGDLYARAGLNHEAKRIFTRVAEGYRHQGFPSKAIALLKKVLRIDPSDLDAAAMLAEYYLEQGLRGEASRQYTDVADAYKRAGREDKALAAYQRLAEIDPSNTSLMMTLGERWQREGLKQRAHTSFTVAGEEYFRQGNSEGALAAYLKAHAVQPDEHKTLAAIASICVARGQADSAIPILSESLSRNSSDAELHRILGSTYLSAGRLDDAERAFQKLLALDGGEYRNLLIVGEKFLENGDLDRAVEQLDGFVDALIANRNEQEAVDFLYKVLDFDPEHRGSLRRLALIFRRLCEDFNLAHTLKALAKSALRRGDRDEAIEALNELCSIEPNELAHRDALQSLGVTAPAIPYAVYSAAESQLENKTSEGSAQRNVLCTAAGMSQRGQTEDATALLRRLLKYQPDNLEVRHALKNIYASAGSRDMAANEYLQIGRIRQATKALAASPHQVTPAGHNTSTGTSTTFELVTGSNRRQARRVSMRVPLVVISDTGGWREFTETIDISEEGLKLQLAHPVAPMTSLRVLFEMAKWPETVAKIQTMDDTSVIVRYCKSRPGEPNHVGVELGSESEQTPITTSPAQEFTDSPRASV